MSDILGAFAALKADAAVRKAVKEVVAADGGDMTEAECQAAYEKITAAVRANGAPLFVVWTCQGCGQKNRVDRARAIAWAVRPRCGKCNGFLRGPA